MALSQSQPYSSRAARSLRLGAATLLHHLKRHVGVGIICSVAYFDPGNWSVDLQAGSSFGYRPMLFVILMAGLGAIVLQTLAYKLGCVTGLDLATHCRLLFHNHPRHPRLVRRLVLYPLYILSEIAIISTDLAELLGSAIGFCLLFPKLPLWAGVVLTAADVLIFLAFSDPSRGQGRPVRLFEYTIIALVFCVFGSFVALLIKAKPNWSQAFLGYLPDKALFQSDPDAVYAAVGILGATVMPHALFLGSSLATQDRVSDAQPLSENYLHRAASSVDYRSKHGERENRPLTFINQHLSHGVVDVVTSLIALAVPINSAILILAAAVFFNGAGQNRNTPAGLFDAYDLIKARIGDAAAVIFALALICAGQTSSITVTLAGQIVSEGFIEWKVSPFLRRIITRCISLVPSMVVSIAVGRDGINTLLVASQVILSVVLPFVAFPLIYLTSAEVVMRVWKPQEIIEAEVAPIPELTQEPHENQVDLDAVKVEAEHMEISTIKVAEQDKVDRMVRKEYLDYSNGRFTAALAYVIWCIVLVANAYAIVMLFLR
ncbi:natural resistance-associated macrophage protein-domain-containing protein [Gymnopilus junonius]|uniref:Natural resistance-associated macrophage protein-domain-containing protein n=1 Tax=Gymnopilus junonius TaxID=109634 RepID=A0A9P5TRA2_GYMJU|nr:natural resistance-associated macrophage protein-domain-containing protein [Gymnopilus junonius]